MDDDLYVVSMHSPCAQSCLKHLEQGNYEAVYEHSLNIIRLHPDQPEGYIFKAKALFNMNRLEEAELVLIDFMKIIQDNEPFGKNTEHLIKLRDEIANVRVGLLKKFEYDDVYDICEMHWGHCSVSILDLIGCSKDRSVLHDQHNSNKRFKSHIDLIDIDDDCVQLRIDQNERSLLLKQLTSNTTIDKSISKSTPNEKSGDNLKFAAEFPVFSKRSKERQEEAQEDTQEEAQEETSNCSMHSNNDQENELKTTDFKTLYLLSEEKNKKLEEKVNKLEQELKEAYNQCIKMNKIIKEKNQEIKDITKKKNQAHEKYAKKKNKIIANMSQEIENLKQDLLVSRNETDVWRKRYHDLPIDLTSRYRSIRDDDARRYDEMRHPYRYSNTHVTNY